MILDGLRCVLWCGDRREIFYNTQQTHRRTQTRRAAPTTIPSHYVCLLGINPTHGATLGFEPGRVRFQIGGRTNRARGLFGAAPVAALPARRQPESDPHQRPSRTKCFCGLEWERRSSFPWKTMEWAKSKIVAPTLPCQRGKTNRA